MERSTQGLWKIFFWVSQHSPGILALRIVRPKPVRGIHKALSLKVKCDWWGRMEEGRLGGGVETERSGECFSMCRKTSKCWQGRARVYLRDRCTPTWRKTLWCISEDLHNERSLSPEVVGIGESGEVSWGMGLKEDEHGKWGESPRMNVWNYYTKWEKLNSLCFFLAKNPQWQNRSIFDRTGFVTVKCRQQKPKVLKKSQLPYIPETFLWSLCA